MLSPVRMSSQRSRIFLSLSRQLRSLYLCRCKLINKLFAAENVRACVLIVEKHWCEFIFVAAFKASVGSPWTIVCMHNWCLPHGNKLLYLIPAKMIGSQNKFSSPPTPFETRGRNVTVCPANICCYFSDLKFCLPATLCKYTDVLNTRDRTNSYMISVTWQKLLWESQQTKECYTHGNWLDTALLQYICTHPKSYVQKVLKQHL
jgi:hypothetical protein